MTDAKCADLEKRSIAERYVAGTLGEAESLEFERHLVGCAQCQATVRMSVAVREEVRAMPASSRRAAPRALTVMAGLAAAAIVFVLARQSTDERALARLGAIGAPPPYRGVEVRSPARADSLFGAAMRLYLEGRHEDAGRALRGARAAGADTVPTSFFIGVTELLGGRPRGTINAMTTVLRFGSTPYEAEAHFFAAKAWLQLGRADSASAHLASASNARTAVAAHARALVDSIAEVRR